MEALWTRFVAYASRPRFLIGASVFRLLTGAGVLVQYLATYRQRHYLFGPDGLYPFEAFATRSSGLTLYSWSSSKVWFELLYNASIVVAALWFLGWKTRWLTPLLYLLWSSLHRRLPLFGDGGDNVLTIVLVFAMFADLNRHFAIETRRPPTPGLKSDVAAMWHNGAILAFALQIALVYGVAGLTKVQGETWRNGTAIYYAMSGTYRLPVVSELICRNEFVVSILSYTAVAFQVSFPWFLFLHRRTRLVAIVGGIFFHIGIGVVLGLVTFATFMMAVDLCLVSDEEYRALFGLCSRVARSVTAPIRARLVPSPALAKGGSPARGSRRIG